MIHPRGLPAGASPGPTENLCSAATGPRELDQSDMPRPARTPGGANRRPCGTSTALPLPRNSERASAERERRPRGPHPSGLNFAQTALCGTVDGLAPWSHEWLRLPRKTERAGFEPAMEFDPHTRLAGECLQPLGHLSLGIDWEFRGCQGSHGRAWRLARRERAAERSNAPATATRAAKPTVQASSHCPRYPRPARSRGQPAWTWRANRTGKEMARRHPRPQDER